MLNDLPQLSYRIHPVYQIHDYCLSALRVYFWTFAILWTQLYRCKRSHCICKFHSFHRVGEFGHKFWQSYLQVDFLLFNGQRYQSLLTFVSCTQFKDFHLHSCYRFHIEARVEFQHYKSKCNPHFSFCKVEGYLDHCSFRFKKRDYSLNAFYWNLWFVLLAVCLLAYDWRGDSK